MRKVYRSIVRGAAVPSTRKQLLQPPTAKQIQEVMRDRVEFFTKDMSKTAATRMLVELYNAAESATTKDGVFVRSLAGIRKAQPSRADLIAITETNAIMNTTTLKSLENSGIRYKRWVTRGDDRVRPAHRRLNGTTRLLKNTFPVMYKKGTVRLQAPSEPRCRCKLVGQKTRTVRK